MADTPDPEVQELAAALHDQPGNPLRPPQVQEYEEERDRLRRMAEAPEWVGGNRGAARRRYQEISRTLAEQAPKAIPGERANLVKRLCDSVLERVLKPALLPQAIMRRNPTTAVGRALKQEFARPFKVAALTWKRGMQALGVADGANQDPDWTNLERFRPEVGGPGDPASFMADAQIPGHFAMSSQAKANFPFADPPNSAVNQVKRAALAKARAAKAQKRSRQGTLAQGAAGTAPTSPGEE